MSGIGGGSSSSDGEWSCGFNGENGLKAPPTTFFIPKAALAEQVSATAWETLEKPKSDFHSSLKLTIEKRRVDKMRWYYEKKELRNAPSIQSGLDQERESRYRREGARFIIDVGSQMNLSLTTMATGVVYFHRFYMFHTFQNFPRYPTALACLFLAGKVEETPKKCRDMLKVSRELLADDKWATFGGDLYQKTEEIMTLERIILQTIKFDLHVEHPYTFLLKYAKCLKGDKARLQKMVQMAWTFVNDSLCTTLCLQWEPEIVAIALMHLAGKLSKFEVVDWVGRTTDHYRWWDMFVEGMTIELLEDICHQVLDLYSQTQSQAQDSPPPNANNRSNAPPHNPPLPSQPPASAPPPPVVSSKSGAQMPPVPYSAGTAGQPYNMYGVPPSHMIPSNYPYPPPPTSIPSGRPPLPGSYPPQPYYPPPPLPSHPQQPPPPPK